MNFREYAIHVFMLVLLSLPLIYPRKLWLRAICASILFYLGFMSVFGALSAGITAQRQYRAEMKSTPSEEWQAGSKATLDELFLTPAMIAGVALLIFSFDQRGKSDATGRRR